MVELTHAQFKEVLKKQNQPREDLLFECPNCKTHQSINDFLLLDSFQSEESAQGYAGFSCIGRFTDKIGCDWTLGGLFKIHKVEVITDEGKTAPVFRPINLDVNKTDVSGGLHFVSCSELELMQLEHSKKINSIFN